MVLRTTAGRLARGPADAVPAWVSQAVLNSQWTPKEALKLSFYLAPHASDDLPALAAGSNKLSAPKVLRMHKVAPAGSKRRPLCLTTPPHLPLWTIWRRRPLLRTPERRPSILEACRGLRSPPQAAPKMGLSPLSTAGTTVTLAPT